MTETTNANNPRDGSGSTESRFNRLSRFTNPSRFNILSRRPGFGSKGQRVLHVGGLVVIGLLALAWTWSIGYAKAASERGDPVPSPSRTMKTALTSAAHGAAYVTDAALEALTRRARGTSGRLRARTVLPTEVEDALNAVNNFAQITLTPFGAKQRGRIGTYLIGSWPGERGARGPAKAPPDRYANPRGFIKVTPENQDTPVSDHFRLRHFLTKNQPNVWPKYLVLEMRLIDKLELVLADLSRRGIRTDGVRVMSGFRTPSYNEGGGNTGGRAGLSRHMYGDAADVYIDNDGNGSMDDLNRDGRVDIRDARFIEESVNRVERANPELIGGAGVYVACCGHGPFIHIDTRGYRARWTGSGGG